MWALWWSNASNSGLYEESVIRLAQMNRLWFPPLTIEAAPLRQAFSGSGWTAAELICVYEVQMLSIVAKLCLYVLNYE